MVRTTLIGVMLGGGLLFAGIAQAQEAAVQQERGEELVAATGGPASPARLVAYSSDRAAVEARDAEVAGAPPEGDGPAVHDATGSTPAHVAAADPSKPRP